MCWELEKENRSESDTCGSYICEAENANLLGHSLGWCDVKALQAFEMSVTYRSTHHYIQRT
jgi:hypothetical protein